MPEKLETPEQKLTNSENKNSAIPLSTKKNSIINHAYELRKMQFHPHFPIPEERERKHITSQYNALVRLDLFLDIIIDNILTFLQQPIEPVRIKAHFHPSYAPNKEEWLFQTFSQLGEVHAIINTKLTNSCCLILMSAWNEMGMFHINAMKNKQQEAPWNQKSNLPLINEKGEQQHVVHHKMAEQFIEHIRFELNQGEINPDEIKTLSIKFMTEANKVITTGNVSIHTLFYKSDSKDKFSYSLTSFDRIGYRMAIRNEPIRYR